MQEPTIEVADTPASEAAMRSAIDPRATAVRRFRLDAAAPAALPPVSALVIDPDVTVAQLLNHASGPLPLRATVESHGGTLLLFVSGTGRVAEYEPGYAYPLGVALRVGDRLVGQATVLALTAERHAFANLIVVNGLDWGMHDVVLESFKQVMDTTETDLFNLTVLEI